MIRGKLVNLRPVEKEDIPKTTRIINNFDVAIPLGSPIIGMSLKEEEDWYNNFYLSDDSGLSSLVIQSLETGEHIGHIGLKDINWKDRKTEIGLFIDQKQWGKGYGTDAMMAMCHFSFSQLNFQRIELGVFAINKQGIACYEKCGFEIEVIEKEASYVRGEYVDDITMGLLKEEFMPIYQEYMDQE